MVTKNSERKGKIQKMAPFQRARPGKTCEYIAYMPAIVTKVLKQLFNQCCALATVFLWVVSAYPSLFPLNNSPTAKGHYIGPHKGVINQNTLIKCPYYLLSEERT